MRKRKKKFFQDNARIVNNYKRKRKNVDRCKNKTKNDYYFNILLYIYIYRGKSLNSMSAKIFFFIKRGKRRELFRGECEKK